MLFILWGIIWNSFFTILVHKICIIPIANKRVSKIINPKKYIQCKYYRYKRVSKQKDNFEKFYMLIGILIKGLGCLIFTDILFADYYKMKLGTDKGKRKKYIIRMNNLNITMSIFILLIYILLSFSNIDLNIIKSFMLIRTLSRSYEILISFSEDIINKRKKRSSLLSADRLKLAISSFFEIIINYSIIDCFNIKIDCINMKISVFEYTIKILMKSIGTSTLINVEHLTLISTMQVCSSMCLISFGLAAYITSNDEI